jgi:hypothetical protein
MTDTTQKGGPTKTVRIWTDEKKDVQKVIAERMSREKRMVTEAEVLSPVIKAFLKREKRKLGI